ncbi:hypothetical protein BC826DRAFT_1047576 [Russula brevipes]|nr:hypothetical protein BC826DRAFT_1047576 [Russula brevipes]
MEARFVHRPSRHTVIAGAWRSLTQRRQGITPNTSNRKSSIGKMNGHELRNCCYGVTRKGSRRSMPASHCRGQGDWYACYFFSSDFWFSTYCRAGGRHFLWPDEVQPDRLILCERCSRKCLLLPHQRVPTAGDGQYVGRDSQKSEPVSSVILRDEIQPKGFKKRGRPYCNSKKSRLALLISYVGRDS